MNGGRMFGFSAQHAVITTRTIRGQPYLFIGILHCFILAQRRLGTVKQILWGLKQIVHVIFIYLKFFFIPFIIVSYPWTGKCWKRQGKSFQT